jgi:CHAP domain
MGVDPRAPIRKRNLKAWAVAHGVPIPTPFRVATPFVGDGCRRLIRDVQAKAFLGGHTTGQFDKMTLDLIKPKLTAGERAVVVALREVGVKESPANSNDGPRVHEYQSTTGAYREAWCASFVTWCFAQSGTHLQGFNTAYCPAFVEQAKANRNNLSLVSKSLVRAGDLALYGPDDSGVSYHIGLVTSPVKGDGSFSAVEGNTSGAPGVDYAGGEVWQHSDRNTSMVLVFIRVGA